jgi:peptidoglycan/LPS O-acetylase OafA/YrhL
MPTVTEGRPATPDTSAAPKTHLRHVEGLRAVAALVVFVNHAYAQTWNPGRGAFPDAPWSAFTYSLVAGHLAVSVFIVISGFCLALPVVDHGDRLRGGATDFFRRRARRILPPYYAALALSLGLIATVIGKPTGTLWDVPIVLPWQAVVSHLLLLQDLFGTGRVNYVFWSIAVEWHIYFLFPLIVLSVRRYGPLRTTLVALAVGYALTFGFSETRLARANPHYLGLFTLGVLAAYVAHSKRPELSSLRSALRSPWLAVVPFVVACCVSKAFGWRASTEHFPVIDFPIGLAAAAGLVSSTQSPRGLLARALSGRPLVFIGTFSYSVYLVHAPLLQLEWQYLLNPLGLDPRVLFSVFMTLGLALVLGAAYGFFRLFEEPFMRARAKRVDRPRSAAVEPVG